MVQSLETEAIGCWRRTFVVSILILTTFATASNSYSDNLAEEGIICVKSFKNLKEHQFHEVYLLNQVYSLHSYPFPHDIYQKHLKRAREEEEDVGRGRSGQSV